MGRSTCTVEKFSSKVRKRKAESLNNGVIKNYSRKITRTDFNIKKINSDNSSYLIDNSLFILFRSSQMFRFTLTDLDTMYCNCEEHFHGVTNNRDKIRKLIMTTIISSEQTGHNSKLRYYYNGHSEHPETTFWILTHMLGITAVNQGKPIKLLMKFLKSNSSQRESNYSVVKATVCVNTTGHVRRHTVQQYILLETHPSVCSQTWALVSGSPSAKQALLTSSSKACAETHIIRLEGNSSC